MVYLLQPSPDSGHGHGHDADEQHEDESREEQDEEEAQAGESSDQPAPNSEPGDIVPDLLKSSSQKAEDADKEGDEQGGEEKAEDQSDDSGSEGEDQQDTPDTSDDEQTKNVAHETDSGGTVEGVQFKGASSATEDGEQSDTRKHIPDAKGGNKKRIESHYGKRQGVAGDDNLEPDENGRTKDKVCRILYPEIFGHVQILIILLACNRESTWRYDYNLRQAGRYFEHGYQTFHGPRQRPRKKQEGRRRTGDSKIQGHHQSKPPHGMVYGCDKISSECTDTMIGRESTWAGRG